MRILHVVGRHGEPVNTLCFGVTADQVFVGTAAPAHGHGHFPTINIFYPAAALPAIQRLFAADDSGPLPHVHIFPAQASSVRIEVAVIFRLPLSRMAVRAQFPALAAVPLAPTVDVILTGETDGPREYVDPFLRLYDHLGYFYVGIAQAQGETVSVLRGWKLDRLHRTAPTPQAIGY